MKRADLVPFYIAKILIDETDSEHQISRKQIEDFLVMKYGCELPERHTFRKMIENLKCAGLDIKTYNATQTKYGLDSRTFEIPELKLMIDALLSARTISKNQCNKLVKKISKLGGKYVSKELTRNIDVENRVKTKNNSALYIIDSINTAINKKCKISFEYGYYDISKKLVTLKDPIKVSPYNLVFSGEYYYLLGLDDKNADCVHMFRTDRILSVPKVLQSERALTPPKDYDVEKYTKNSLRSFSGDWETVELECEMGENGKNSVVNSLIDKFGLDVKITPMDDEHFRASVEVCINHIFYQWVFGFGGKVKIVSPKSVKDEYHKMLLFALDNI